MQIDAHCHLDEYGDALPRVLDELERLGVFAVSVSVDPDSYAATKTAAAARRNVLPTFGIHPWSAPDFAGRLDELAPLVAETPLIGEVGLDYHFVEDGSRFAAQRVVFDHFLTAASEQDKVVSLHAKGAEDDVLAALRRHATRRAIVHGYSGPVRAFVGLVEHGAYFTVGVEVLHSDVIREIAAEIPQDRLLTETDNPRGHRRLTGGDGQPRHLAAVIEELARIRGGSAGAMRELVRANFERLIDGDPRLTVPYGRARGVD